METRKHFDPRTGHDFTVNVRTGIVYNRTTGEYPDADTTARIYKAVNRRVVSAHNRKMHDFAMRDLGLVKVRGNLGGTYWE